MKQTFEQLFEQLIEGIIDGNYGTSPSFLGENLVAGLYENIQNNIQAGKLRPAGIGNQNNFQNNHQIRTDAICWLEPRTTNEAERQFFQLIDAFVAYLNRTCFTNITDYEFHYAMYEKGAFYKRHKDRFKTDDRRKFSVVMYLNKNWQPEDGGALVVYTPNGTAQVLPEAGRVVFFKSDELEHEVLQANRTRYSITGWLK